MVPAASPVIGSSNWLEVDGNGGGGGPLTGWMVSCTGAPPAPELSIVNWLLVSSHPIPGVANALGTICKVALRLTNEAVASSVGLPLPCPSTRRSVTGVTAPALPSVKNANCAPGLATKAARTLEANAVQSRVPEGTKKQKKPCNFRSAQEAAFSSNVGSVCEETWNRKPTRAVEGLAASASVR